MNTTRSPAPGAGLFNLPVNKKNNAIVNAVNSAVNNVVNNTSRAVNNSSNSTNITSRIKSSIGGNIVNIILVTLLIAIIVLFYVYWTQITSFLNKSYETILQALGAKPKPKPIEKRKLKKRTCSKKSKRKVNRKPKCKCIRKSRCTCNRIPKCRCVRKSRCTCNRKPKRSVNRRSKSTVNRKPRPPQRSSPRKSMVEKVIPGQGQVFNISKNSYTFYDAEPLCKALNAELATYEQVKEAYKKGADWCNYGWVKGQMAVYPTQKATYQALQAGPEKQRTACGNVGLNGGYFDNPELKFGVNCYGTKPDQRAHDATAVAAGEGAPLSPGAIEQQKKVARFRGETNYISVLPWNKNKWSS